MLYTITTVQLDGSAATQHYADADEAITLWCTRMALATQRRSLAWAGFFRQEGDARPQLIAQHVRPVG